MNALETESAYGSLKPWTFPQNYGGATWYGWYPVYSRTRDSDSLDNSNYTRILEDLRKLDSEMSESAIDSRNVDYDSAGDSTVTDTSCNHWACGWVETIYVHSSNISACAEADSILDALADYPVYDETAYSALESEQLQEYWENCGMRERIDICKRAGASMFQARIKRYFDLNEVAYTFFTDRYRD